MSKLDNVRISLKIDDLSNWNNSNITLNIGEVALIRLPNNQVKIKVGDGSSQISDLNYLNEQEFFTAKLSANNVEFGFKNYAQRFSVAEGQNVSAYGTYQHAAGYNVEAISNETFAFVWNGKNLYGYNNRYKSHGAGTFSLNPENGLSGFYIGEEHLANILCSNISNEIEPLKNSINQNIATLNNNITGITQATNSLATNFTIVDGKVNELSQDIENKILIDSEKADQFEVKHISQDDYHALVNSEEGALSNAIYIVSSDTLNMYGEQIKNVAPGTDLSDAVNLEQMQSTIAQVSNDLNDEIANINSSLNNYATKTELTNNVTQLNNDINTLKSNDNIISSAVDNKILIDNISVDTFEVKHISQDDYNDLVVNDAALSNIIYIVSSDTLDMYGEQIKNLADGTEATDAANLGQVSSSITTVEKTLDNKINQINSKILDYALSNDVKNITNTLANNIDNKVLIDGISSDQLEIKHVSRDEYYDLVNSEEGALSNAIYIVSGDTLNAYNQRIENVADGIEDTDGANVRQLSYKLVDIELVDNGTSLSCKLENRTISTITIDSDEKPIVIAFPNVKNGYARDFILQVNVTLASTENLQIEWEGLDDSWNAVSDSDDWAILEPGLNVISFTEMN